MSTQQKFARNERNSQVPQQKTGKITSADSGLFQDGASRDTKHSQDLVCFNIFMNCIFLQLRHQEQGRSCLHPEASAQVRRGASGASLPRGVPVRRRRCWVEISSSWCSAREHASNARACVNMSPRLAKQRRGCARVNASARGAACARVNASARGAACTRVNASSRGAACARVNASARGAACARVNASARGAACARVNASARGAARKCFTQVKNTLYGFECMRCRMTALDSSSEEIESGRSQVRCGDQFLTVDSHRNHES